MTSPALAERREDRQRLKGNPPSLEVHPLHISGHPTNRVNLVFFADGCKLPVLFSFGLARHAYV